MPLWSPDGKRILVSEASQAAAREPGRLPVDDLVLSGRRIGPSEAAVARDRPGAGLVTGRDLAGDLFRGNGQAHPRPSGWDRCRGTWPDRGSSYSPRFSPDGRHLSYISGTKPGDEERIPLGGRDRLRGPSSHLPRSGYGPRWPDLLVARRETDCGRFVRPEAAR